jgi:hypothetical protein
MGTVIALLPHRRPAIDERTISALMAVYPDAEYSWGTTESGADYFYVGQDAPMVSGTLAVIVERGAGGRWEASDANTGELFRTAQTFWAALNGAVWGILLPRAQARHGA